MYNKVHDIQLKSIKSVNSDFNPRLPLDLVTKFFNHVNDVAKSMINFISRIWKMRIPSTIFGMFSLSDVKLAYHDDYFEAAMTPKFIPQELPDYKAEYEQWYAARTPSLPKMPEVI